MEATAPPYSKLPDIHEFGRKNMELTLLNKESPTSQMLAESFNISPDDAERLQARYYAILAHSNKTGKSMADAKAEVEKISVYKNILNNGQNLSDKQVQFLLDNGEAETVMKFLNKDTPSADPRVNKGVANNKEYITAGLHKQFLNMGGRKSRRHSKKSRRHSKKSRRHSKKSRKSRKCRR